MPSDPTGEFQAYHYVRHNQRRLEHLATLGLDLAGRTVLEVGAGIGDHTGFFVDRDCSVLTSDGRPENYEILKRRWSWLDVRLLDLDAPGTSFTETFEVVYCYGTLYHLRRPAQALAFLSRACRSLLLVETCVSTSEDDQLLFVAEDATSPSQARWGEGCRPSRRWVHERLRELFSFVYMPTTQPWHPEFPVDWSRSLHDGELARAIFIASRTPIDNPVLTQEIPRLQTRR